jgi:alpha-mannosidase
MEQDGVSGTVMPLDAGLVTLGDINRGSWPLAFGQRPGTVFSYVMNNYWNTNYRAAQGGAFRFRYVITSASTTSPAQLSRMGWEEMTPLESDLITSQDKAQNGPQVLNGGQASFLQMDDRDVLLEAWKPAEDGNGTILRFLDLGGETRVVTVHMALPKFKEAWQTDAVERDLQPLALCGTDCLQFKIGAHQIVTVSIAEPPAPGR